MRVSTSERRKLDAEDMLRMNVPEALWRVRLQWVPESVRSVVQNYCEKFDTMAEKGAGLLLWGNDGVGKSGVAVCLAKEARARGYTVLFTTASELREAVQERRAFDDTHSMFARAQEVDVLVLDNLRDVDLSLAFTNQTRVEDLMIGRGAQRKITIATTRLTFSELASEHESFVRSTSGSVVPLEVTGPDLNEKRSELLHNLVVGRK